MKRALAVSTAVAATLLATPAWAPFHEVVIEQVFFGTEAVPRAQFVLLRTLSSGQIFVQGQPLSIFAADGTAAGLFGRFSKPLTTDPGPDAAMIAGTAEAEDLFCLAMDERVTGALPFPDGRLCFAIFTGNLPVDCVGYGAFTGENSPYGEPAVAPEIGVALVRTAETDDNQNDFALLPPVPQNNPGAVGAIDGTPGDADGSGTVDAGDVERIGRLGFASPKRCGLPAAERGADANVDTRINAADVVAAAGLLTA